MEQKKIDLICIDNTGYEGFLTLHKWYKGQLIPLFHQGSDSLPTIKIGNLSNDRSGNKDVHETKVFMTKQQWRDYNIEKVLTDKK